MSVPHFLMLSNNSENRLSRDLLVDDFDNLLPEAARLIVTHQQGSTSLIQRKMKLVYNRAGRIMDQLETIGVVGPFTGSKSRDVMFMDLVNLEDHLRAIGIDSTYSQSLYSLQYSIKGKIFMDKYLPDYQVEIYEKVKSGISEHKERIRQTEERIHQAEIRELKAQILEMDRQAKEKRRVLELRKDLEKSMAQEGLIDSVPEYRREPIPQSVKNDVWNRDGGKCVQCGLSNGLEFDHIIPISKGGANTYRNLQLLCESCNRQKSNSIG